MIRTILSLGSIMVAAALLVTGTVAFFSDTESSVGNVFAAGALDLLIDNDSYYNGNRCTNVGTEEEPVWEWVGEADYPEAGTTCSTSFLPGNLDDGLLFFNFTDVKPDDEGEDTISIHTQNDAWVCMDLTLTSDDDNSSTEPELDVDDEENPEDLFDGELASGINFFWWADDGDNVYESDENAITDGVVSLADLDQTFPVALADSQNNVWGEDGPVPGEETVYIAKAWCLGELTLDAVPEGEGVNPSVASGVICDGSDLGNEFQTDGASLDIQFSAVQARNNEGYLCEAPEFGSLTVNKIVNGGEATADQFSFTVNGPSGEFTGVQDGDTLNGLIPGDYTVVEEDGGPSGYEASFASCGDGTVAVSAGNNTDCTVTNTSDPATVTVDKLVAYSTPGLAVDPSNFLFTLTNNDTNAEHFFTDEVPDTLPAGTYTITETYAGIQNISFAATFSDDCSEIGATDTGTMTVENGLSYNCQVLNQISASGSFNDSPIGDNQ